MPDPIAVNSMFGRIAARYDLANRLLSGGVDQGWRRCLVRTVAGARPQEILDLATGSGDVAFALGRAFPRARIVGGDFCEPMLAQAEQKKAAAKPAMENVTFQVADGLALPFPDAGFDAVTISFGLRNMADRHRCLQEMRRVLRPGGRVFVLEFSQPFRWFRPFYFFYLRKILPRFAGWVTGDRAAYCYLNETIEDFPDASTLAKEFERAGFSHVAVRRMTFGIVALHSATK